MSTTNRCPATAAALLAWVEPFGPAVAGGGLSFAAAPPANLIPVLIVLHTGVRAILGRLPWWGAASDKPMVVKLNPADLIPPGITLLAVERDQSWDRIHPDARRELPQLFV